MQAQIYILAVYISVCMHAGQLLPQQLWEICHLLLPHEDLHLHTQHV